MNLIVNGGNAKSSAMAAIKAAKQHDFEQAKAKLAEADQFIHDAHLEETALLTTEASGEPLNITLLMIHSQDHMMNAITYRDLAAEIIELYAKLDQVDDTQSEQ
ncbi:PTS lactose/cellobiose transporter subunit IIA [Agrilactobacillus fermenti]|uniref:PTS lactose/cellobiose transporter subunit IIA n=1 Tax=Agrilactobacillus fermenti TaxID=2586909 RepID=UPI001E33B717|nr:PTS lactose/cellobiose transporter subunit IIA [Agrilactobacillus fermenti]MCD2255162.1 PTS lactose/cellobiose transporter subunit IIA [Agrilactobacillus fermenti]